MSPMLTVNREELLKFFDDRSDCSKGHATSVVAVVGEDLTRKFQCAVKGAFSQWVKLTPGNCESMFIVPTSLHCL